MERVLDFVPRNATVFENLRGNYICGEIPRLIAESCLCKYVAYVLKVVSFSFFLFSFSNITFNVIHLITEFYHNLLFFFFWKTLFKMIIFIK